MHGILDGGHHYLHYLHHSLKVKLFSCVQLFVTPWTVAYQAPPSMGFFRQEYWSGLPFPSPGDLPNPGIEPRSPAFQADTLTSEPPGKPTTPKLHPKLPSFQGLHRSYPISYPCYPSKSVYRKFSKTTFILETNCRVWASLRTLSSSTIH